MIHNRCRDSYSIALIKMTLGIYAGTFFVYNRTGDTDRIKEKSGIYGFMIKKKERLVITFHTTTDAMAMEQECKIRNVKGRLIPVPRSISAGCGLAWCAEPESEAMLGELMRICGIVPQDIHRCMI